MGIIIVLAAWNSYADPGGGEHTENSTRDSAMSHSQIQVDGGDTSRSAEANRHILFNGGGSVFHGAEYSQYEHFLTWYKWSVKQPNSKTVSVFSDGFRDKKNGLNLYEVIPKNFFEISISNLILLEGGEIVFRRASFPNNFPATYTSLRERFEEANHQTHDLLIVIGDHGISLVKEREYYCQPALQGELDSGYTLTFSPLASKTWMPEIV